MCGHKGDSITVAPAQKLTDKEFQIMRNASIAVLRKICVVRREAACGNFSKVKRGSFVTT